MKDVTDILDLSVEQIQELMTLAKDMLEHKEKYAEACKGKQLATLFYEPSTRTRLSFESAMLAMGGSVVGFSGAQNASVSKGESVHDTSIVVSQLVDIIAMRHNLEGAPFVASQSCNIPVINAGDGGHNHPTQTLLDLFTIYQEKGRLNHLTVGFVGDLKYGRTVHSLLNALARYTGIRVVLISPEVLALPQWVKQDVLDAKQIPYVESTSLEEHIQDLDVLYMTRIQKERFDSMEVYDRVKDLYILDEEKMQKAKKDCIILHPLPRVNEIRVKVDEDPRACYFKQVKYGKYMRMALMYYLLHETDGKRTPLPEGTLKNVLKCDNPRCITSTEQELDHLFRPVRGNTYRCIYCEREKQLNK